MFKKNILHVASSSAKIADITSTSATLDDVVGNVAVVYVFAEKQTTCMLFEIFESTYMFLHGHINKI